MKILIVDDDAALLTMMQRMLEHRGHTVRTCSSPFGVSAMVVRELPEVILLDIMMPGLTGSTLASLVGKLDVKPRPTVVLWSAMDEGQLKKAGQEAGNVPTISKTLRPSQIAENLERIAGAAKPPTP